MEKTEGLGEEIEKAKTPVITEHKTNSGIGFMTTNYMSQNDFAAIAKMYFEIMDNTDETDKIDSDAIRGVKAKISLELALIDVLTDIDISKTSYEALLEEGVIKFIDEFDPAFEYACDIKEMYNNARTPYVALHSITDSISMLINGINKNMSQENLAQMTDALTKLGNVDTDKIVTGIKDSAMKKS